MPIPPNAQRNPDRTCHAWLREDGVVVAELVRYDRAGKWYVEYRDDRKRRQVSLSEAVRLAVPATVHFRKPGGMAFEAKVRAARAAASKSN